jgi:hypothetical protein
MYYDVRIKKHVRLNVPYSTELLAIRENPVPVPGCPALKLGAEHCNFHNDKGSVVIGKSKTIAKTFC